VGQDISRKLEVIFSQGLREAEQQTFILNYRPLGSLDLRAIKQDNNAFQFGAMYELRFGLAREPRPLPGLGSVAAGPVIDRVDMKGDLGLPRPSVVKRLKLGVGKRFDFFVFQKDLDRLNALYFKNGFLEADIDYRKDDVDGGAVLTYQIDAGPRVSLVTEGAAVPGPVSARMRRLWKDAAFDGQRMGDVRRLLETEFFRQGHYQAKFRFVIREDAPGTRTVLVRIAPGPRYEKLIQLFEGVSEPQEKLLRAVLDRPESVHLLFARPVRLADDLETVLRRDGFLDAEASEPIIDFRPEEGVADVTFPVRPGPRFVFGGVDFEGRSRLALSVVAPAAGVAPGDPFSADSLDQAEERLERLYRTNGFTESRIGSRIARQPGQSAVDVVFVIEENDQAVIDTVRITGNRITADGVIARELEFGPGDFVDDRTFSAAQRRLYRLGVFRAIDVEARPKEGAAAGGAEPAPTPHDVEVRVDEIQPYYVRAGGQYDTDTGVGGTAELFRRNFLGRAIDAGAGVQADRREQSGRLYVRSPYFLGARIDTSLSGFAKRTKEADYTTNRLGASFQQQVRFRAAYVLSWNYTFEHLRNLLNGLPAPGQLYDVGRITLSVTRDRRANFLNSVRGSFVALTADYAAKFLGSDVPYLRFMGQYYIYVPVGRSLTYAFAGRLGLGKGPGRTSPTERFFAGGASSIRGFAFHEVGPADPVTGLPAGGDALLIVNQELRFPIYKSLTGVAFVDLGNVYPAVRDFNPLRVRKTAGVGLRFDLGFALGRLDLAFKLDRRPGESVTKVHFSLGQAF
jgi:outer membrane protein assembly complex protein YaeT